jgi:hypothetical protein
MIHSVYKYVTGILKIRGGTDGTIIGNEGDGIKVVSGSLSEKVLVDEASDTVSYFGFAVSGTATSASTWKIFKISVSGTVTTKNFADSVTTYTKKWDDRATYTY